MTREYIYYPYLFESDLEKFPEKIKKMLSDNMSVHFNMTQTIKKLVFYGRNKIADPQVMIRCIDYFICKFFFPLEANGIYWEMCYDSLGKLLDEERRQFYSL